MCALPRSIAVSRILSEFQDELNRLNALKPDRGKRSNELFILIAR